MKNNNENLDSYIGVELPKNKSTAREIVETVGWALVVIVPILIYFFAPAITVQGSENQPRLFLCILSSTTIMWALSLLPSFVPGIFALLATALLSLTDSNTILAGFSSANFIIVLSICTMIVCLGQSGILNRILLHFLRNSSSANSAGWKIFGFSLLITPIIPSVISRCQLLGPLINRLSDYSDGQKNHNNDTLFYTSAYIGGSLLTSSFLSASLLNFVIISLLPLQEQQEFHMIGWFQATIVLTAVLLISYFLLISICFYNKSGSSSLFHKFNIENEKKNKISYKEMASLGIIIFFFVGILTTRYHHVAGSWLGLSLLFLLLALRLVSIDDFRKKVDWTFLLFLSSIIGIATTFKSLGLDVWTYKQLLTHYPHIVQDKELIFISLTIFVLILRLALPVGAVVALLASIALAIADKIGISGWVLCFVILFVGDMWFFPYQNEFYQIYKNSFDMESHSINEKKFLIINAIFNVIKIFGLYLSFYHWKYLSLI